MASISNKFSYARSKLYLNTGSKFLCIENKDDPRSNDHPRIIDAIDAPMV
jgi:hypothetical protein